RLAAPVEVAQLRQDGGAADPIRRRLVVVADAELERQLRHPLDRLGRNPRDRGDGSFESHAVPPCWPPPDLTAEGAWFQGGRADGRSRPPSRGPTEPRGTSSSPSR